MTVVLVGAVIGIWLCALWCLLTDPTPVPPSHEPPSGCGTPTANAYDRKVQGE
jgi:hypothetical protein